MLVLSRKVGEEIVIGDSIRVKVLSVRGNQIRLGFTAPPDVTIHRAELCQQASTQGVAGVAKPSPVPLPTPDVIVVAEPPLNGLS